MATQYENFSVSEINFTQAAGSDLNDSGSHSLVITPNSGFTVNSADFDLTAPIPAGITNYSFVQSGSNVVLNFEFADNTIMPGNNIEFPLCIQGNASSELYTIQGNFTLNTQNAIPSSEAGEYSKSSIFASTSNVLTKTVAANGGFYFFEEPQLSIAIGNQNNYDVVTNKTYDIDQNLVAVEFVVSYTFPNVNITGDSIVIQANAIPIVVETQLINGFTLNGNSGYTYTANSAGETLTLNLIGDPGALYSVELIDVNLDSTIYASNVAMSATGVVDIPNIIIPFIEDEKSPYELKITGDINPNISNDGTSVIIDIEQQAQVGLKITAETDNPYFEVTGSPEASLFSPNTEYAPGPYPVIDFSFIVTSSGGNILEDGTIGALSFAPAIPSPNIGDEDWTYSLQSISQSLNSPDNNEFTVTGSIIVNTSGDNYITHTLNLDSWISTPSNVTYDSVILLDECSSLTGIGKTIIEVDVVDLVVGEILTWENGQFLEDLPEGTYRMSNGLSNNQTYNVNEIITSEYHITINNSGAITDIIQQCNNLNP